jgi:hypothetical protein
MSNQKVPYPKVDMQAIHPEDKPDLILAYIIKQWDYLSEESQAEILGRTEKYAQENRAKSQAWLEKMVSTRKTQIQNMTVHLSDAHALANYVAYSLLHLPNFFGVRIIRPKEYWRLWDACMATLLHNENNSEAKEEAHV